MNDRPITRIDAAAVRDATGVDARPGVVAVQEGRVLYAGLPDGAPPGDRTLHLPDRLVLPQLINAHTHLELTAIGPRPYTGDFVSWVRMLREHWPGAGDPWRKRPDERWFVAAAAEGARQSLASGVGCVGDIERSPRVAAAVAETGLVGIGYVELFGLGPPWDTPALAAIAETGSDPIFEVGAEKGSDPLFEVGWQPHAPYSAGPGLFAAAARSGRPVCTHLAETVAEHRFVAEATGPYRELLERIGKWDAANASAYRGGLSPVQWMRPYLEQAPWLLAHCNYVDDADIALLAETGASVAYCPIASEYFGHTGHRYRDMLAAGVNVCLGTDSIVCQPAGEPQPLGILPQMRRLHERDDAAPDLLLQMATVNAARALQLPAAAATLAPGAPAALASARIDPADATDPLAQAMRRRAALEPVEL